jgi:RNA polymerase subunit RPABC4/transcription elongation factor Spt4
METEVYLVCPNCNEITLGKGSGDFRDLITCDKCENMITSNWIGMFKLLDSEDEKRLYYPEETS